MHRLNRADARIKLLPKYQFYDVPRSEGFRLHCRDQSEQVWVSRHLSHGLGYHLRLKRVHIEKPIVQLQRGECLRRREFRI